MNNFKVVKNPDGTMGTAPAAPDPKEALQKTRQGLRDMLEGGGWYEDPNAAPKPADKPASEWAFGVELKGLVWVKDEPLPDGVDQRSDGTYFAECRACGNTYDIDYDIKDFTECGNYCGGSLRCIP